MPEYGSLKPALFRRIPFANPELWRGLMINFYDCNKNKKPGRSRLFAVKTVRSIILDELAILVEMVNHTDIIGVNDLNCIYVTCFVLVNIAG
jgi:hypothetical protein